MLLVSCASSSSTAATSPVIAKVGSQVIRQSSLDLRLKAVLTSLSQGGAPTPKGKNDPMLEKVRANVLQGLITDAVIAQEAQYRHLAVTTAEVDAEVQSDEQSAGGANALQSQLSQAGGSMAQLRDEITSRDNEAALENYFATQRVQAVLGALAAGTPFESVARQYSDDSNTGAKGGDMGTLSLSTLNGSDPKFVAALEKLQAGETMTEPVRDASGYDLLRLDARTGDTWSVHRILVSAPQPYTVLNRPQWFAQSLLDAVAQLCAQNQIHVYVDPSVQPCTAPAPSTPSPSP